MTAAMLLVVTLARPAWLDFSLAGYTIDPSARRGSVGVQDEQKGFFLVREIECDGGCATLLLTKDRKAVETFGYRVPSLPPNADATRDLKSDALRHLSTGKGISIGDTESRVARRLGNPSKTRHPEGFPDCDEWVFTWQQKHGKDENPTHHEASYTFRGGKLIEVRFSRSSC